MQKHKLSSLLFKTGRHKTHKRSLKLWLLQTLLIIKKMNSDHLSGKLIESKSAISFMLMWSYMRVMFQLIYYIDFLPVYNQF